MLYKCENLLGKKLIKRTIFRLPGFLLSSTLEDLESIADTWQPELSAHVDVKLKTRTSQS